MTGQPLVSIILPTFNGARYLEKAVDSCLMQTYQKWELIIVDDASTDNTPRLISGFTAMDNRIKAIRHELNRKLPSALNTGFSHAAGSYLTWTSDDNCYRPEAIAEMLTFLESDFNTDLVYCDYTLIDEEDKEIEKIRVGEPEILWKRNCIGPCFLYRRTVQERLGGYVEGLVLAEDYDFWLRASVLCKLSPLHKDLYLYRVHKKSLTQQEQREKIFLATEKVLRQNIRNTANLSPESKSMGYLGLACICNELGRRQGALKDFYKALRTSRGFVINHVLNYERKLLTDIILGKKFSDFLHGWYMKIK